MLVINLMQAGYEANNGQEANTVEVVIGWDKWPGLLPYFVAYEKGFFHDNNLTVELKNESSYSAMISDLENQRIDFSGDVALVDLIMRGDDSSKLMGIGVNDYSDGADGIIARKGISGVSDLRGKKIGVEKDTLREILLARALTDAKLKLGDINEIDMPADEGIAALRRGEVDAVISYEPELSLAVADGAGKIIYTSADAPKLIVDLMAVNKTTIDSRPEVISALVRSYFQSLDYIRKNPKQSAEIGAKYLGVTPDLFSRILTKISFADQEDNRKAFMNYGDIESLYGNSRWVSYFLLDQNKISGPRHENDFLNGNFMNSIIGKS